MYNDEGIIFIKKSKERKPKQIYPINFLNTYTHNERTETR